VIVVVAVVPVTMMVVARTRVPRGARRDFRIVVVTMMLMIMSVGAGRRGGHEARISQHIGNTSGKNGPAAHFRLSQNRV
jgi:hypothetical protein